METPDRLALTLQRIEESLAVLTLDYFGGNDEPGQRVIDDMHFLHRELKAGRKTLPLPKDERRPLNIAIGYDGYFSEAFAELSDRAIDLRRLFLADRWPLLPWQAEPIGERIPDEAGLRNLYVTLRKALVDRRLDDFIAIVGPAVRDVGSALLSSEFALHSERSYLEGLMNEPDYEVKAPAPEACLVRPMFDRGRVRLLDPDENRHALGIYPYTEFKNTYQVRCIFGRIDGLWAVVGYH